MDLGDIWDKNRLPASLNLLPRSVDLTKLEETPFMGTIVRRLSTKESNREKAVFRIQAKIDLKGVKLTATFSNETQANNWIDKEERRIRREFKEGTLNRADRKLTVKDAIERYRKERLTELTAGETVWKYILNRVETYLGDSRLCDLTRAAINEARTEYQNSRKPPLSPATCNKFTTALSMVLTEARVEWEWMTHNPMEGYRKKKGVHHRTNWLRDEQREALFKAANGAHFTGFPTFLWVLLLTGYRKATVMNLLWREVNFEKNAIVLEMAQGNFEGKRGKPRARIVPMVPQLKKVLLEWKTLLDKAGVVSSLVFPSGEDVKVPWNPRSAFESVRRKAKLPDLKMHDLRHTTATYLHSQKVPLEIIQKILGHTDIRMTMIYAHEPDKIMAFEMGEAFGEILGEVEA
jgi:integrase